MRVADNARTVETDKVREVNKFECSKFNKYCASRGEAMVGISSYGAYVPLYRLSLGRIAAAWNRSPRAGEKAVANYDEDSITMGVEAAIDCLRGVDRNTIDGLFFASTTMPYKEKQSASIIATALDLDKRAYTVDFANSLRAGADACRAATNAIRAGTMRRILVVASDFRLAAPGSEYEEDFGGGAAGILLADSDIMSTFKGNYWHTNGLVDIWRTDGSNFVRSWEKRFILTHGYIQNMREAIFQVLKESGLAPKDFSKVVCYCPDARSLVSLSRNLGFNIKSQVQDPLFGQLGNTGCAFSLMLLVAALEEAKSGDKILFASYGDGYSAYILDITDGIEEKRNRRGIRRHLASKQMLPSYEKYMLLCDMIQKEPEREPHPPLYGPLLWRECSQIVALHGSRCKRCGTVQFPIQRVCVNCQAKDDFEEIGFADRQGKVFTYTKDNLAPCIDPPLIKVVVDFDDGGRGLFTMTDVNPDEVQIGMPVEMTLRRLMEAGILVYFWKCRPLRVKL